MKLANQFSSFKHKTSKSYKLEAILRYNSAYPNRQVGFRHYLLMLVIGPMPAVGMLCIIIGDLFFRRNTC